MGYQVCRYVLRAETFPDVLNFPNSVNLRAITKFLSIYQPQILIPTKFSTRKNFCR